MCFDKRKTPAKVLAVCSIIAMIFGILMIAFSALFTNSSVLDAISKEDPDLDDAKKLIFMVLLIFSLATLGVAALGLVLVCVKNRCITCTYGIVLLPTWIVVLIIGAISTLAATAAEEALDEACAQITGTLNRDEFVDTIGGISSSGSIYGSSEIGYDFDIYNLVGLNRYMCSANCPCDVTHSAKWADRPREGFPYVWVAAVGDSAFKGVYTKYSDCLAASEHTDPNFTTWAGEINAQTEVLDWMQFFEEEYDCGGICVVSNFYWSKDLSAGPPTDACLKAMEDGLSSAFMGLSVCTLLAGIFLLFMFIWQYCLWKKYD